MDNLVKNPGKFSYSFDKNGFIGVLTFGGVLTKDCFWELCMTLIETMKDNDCVVVNLDQVGRIDASCLSLFCMISRSAYLMDKRMNLGCVRPEQKMACSLACSLHMNGTKQQGCAARCFWLDTPQKAT